MKNALIISLGDVLNGDEGIGCYILEALAREPVKASVRLLYLGDDPRWAGGSIYAADMVIIVGAFHLGGPAGRMHTWSYKVFRQHMAWMADEYQLIRFLVQALSRADLSGGLPKDLSFLWIEPRKNALEQRIVNNQAVLDDVVQFQGLLDGRIKRLFGLAPEDLYTVSAVEPRQDPTELASVYLTCCRCGEQVLKSRIIEHEGQVYCTPCFQRINIGPSHFSVH